MSSWLALATSAIVSLVITPEIIRHLGMDVLGVWRVIMVVVGYYGLVDMALLGAVMRFLAAMFVAGVVQLKLSLWFAVREVNAQGAPPDTTEWELQE